jgi:hypothetical protein
VECSPVSVRLRIIYHNISVGLTNTNMPSASARASTPPSPGSKAARLQEEEVYGKMKEVYTETRKAMAGGGGGQE